MPVLTRQQQPVSPWTKQRSVYVPADLYTSSVVNISFKDITLTAKPGPTQKAKQILKGLSGQFKCGELTAILGPSGAGKTSFLNILTGFRTEGMHGTIMSNDKVVQPSKSSFRKQTAYIMQDDRLCPFFTVQEIMVIAAQLKLGKSMPEKAKLLIIDEILNNLSMSETKDTRCSLLSGGQRRRLGIALELIDNPAVLYLDEPTTGLDSSSTLQLLRLLSAMSRQGKNVICTIHQPSATMFELLDHVFVVADGRCVYQGTPKNVIPFLESINLPCPKFHNPADFLLDVVTGEFGDYMDKLRMNGSNPMWRSGSDDKSKEGNSSWHSTNIKTAVIITPPSEYEKIFVLMKSIIIQIHRNWLNTYMKLVLHIILGILIGAFYANIGFYGHKVINNVGYFMAILVYTTFLTMLPATITFPNNLQVLMKERFNNWYNFKTYFLAFFLVNTPIQVGFMWIFIIISFFLSSQFFDYFRLILFLTVGSFTTLFAEYLGIALGATNKPASAIFNGSIYLAICLTLAGFAILLPHMPALFYYLSYTSFMRFSLETLVSAAYGFDRPPLPCPENVLYCAVKQPSQVMEIMGMTDKNIPIDFLFLASYTFGMVIIAFFCIRKSIKDG